MDIVLLISGILSLFFGALWISDEYFSNKLKKLVICCIIISIISLIALQFKTTYISFITSSIIIINGQVIKFNKPVEIKKIVIKSTYGTLEEINYEVLN